MIVKEINIIHNLCLLNALLVYTGDEINNLKLSKTFINVDFQVNRYLI